MLSLPTLAQPPRTADKRTATKPLRHAIVPPNAVSRNGRPTAVCYPGTFPCEKIIRTPFPLRALDLDRPIKNRQRRYGCQQIFPTNVAQNPQVHRSPPPASEPERGSSAVRSQRESTTAARSHLPAAPTPSGFPQR